MLLGKVDAAVATPVLEKKPTSLSLTFDLDGLAALTGLSAKQLGYFLYKRQINNSYSIFRIPKKTGGEREICSPNPTLKMLQRNLLSHLAELRIFKASVTAFIRGRDIADNAEFHVGKKFVLNIDLEDFFGSINFGRVYGMLTKKPYELERSVAAAITKAVIFQNKLPQGAPSSPVLSNLVCTKLDAELQSLCSTNGCTYSRYADDITISTQRSRFPLATRDLSGSAAGTIELSSQLREIIASNGFRINEIKTRLYFKTDRQEVTGLVVNKRVNIRRSYIRDIRAVLHAIQKYGSQAAQETFEKKSGGKTDLLASIAGRISFVGQIRGKSDQVYRALAKKYNHIVSSETLKFALTPYEVANKQPGCWRVTALLMGPLFS